jgi:hypothetical protein
MFGFFIGETPLVSAAASLQTAHQLCHRRKSDGLLNGGVSPIVFIEWMIRGEFKTLNPL